MNAVCRHCLGGFAFALLAMSHGFSQQSETVALVDDQSISLNEVHYFLDRTLKNLPSQSDRKTRSEQVIALGVEHCIKRVVVLGHLRDGKFKTSKKEVRFQIEELTAQLEAKGKTLDDHLDEIRLTETEFHRELEWLTSWRKYARTYVTLEHLKNQFENNQARYDGRQIRVAQILWKDSSQKTVELAATVRDKINDGTLQWQDAVGKHSQAESAKDNGDLGWIKFAGPMFPKFNEVSFGLAVGEISIPFTTSFGTHLVKCLELKPGDLTFEDVVAQVRADETNRLFELVAKKHRDGKKIVTTRTDQ